LIVQFVLQSLVMTGGFRVVAEHARGLRSRGHEVRLLVPHAPWPRPGAPLVDWKRWAYERFSRSIPDGLAGYDLGSAVVRFDPRQTATVPPGDVVVATAWKTAEWVAAMPPSAGKGHYLIQQYEAWDGADTFRVDATWRLPLRRIVIAGWLEALGRERFGVDTVRIPNGVDARRFHPPVTRPASPPCVGMLYDLSPWKGADDGVQALWRLHEERPEVRFLLFGRYRRRHAFPPGTTYAREPRQSELPDLYGRMHVFLNSSHSEGFSLVTLEAMACGCALVATDVGEVPVMGKPGVEYLMAPHGDPEAQARAVLELVDDSDRLRAVAREGLALARRYDWDRATDLLEAVLRS
jgi:glycosyltransferase involved in cell wall biosynthesis